MSNHTKYKKIVLSVAIILALSTMFVACASTEASPNKSTPTNENSSEIVANTNIPEVIVPSTDMAVNRQFIDELRKAISGSNTIEDLLKKFDWNVDKKSNKYDFEMIFDDSHGYLVSICIDDDEFGRAINYDKDVIVIKDTVNGGHLENPTVSSFLKTMQRAQHNIEPDKYQLNENILKAFMECLDGDIPLGDLVEEFSFYFSDGVYTNTLCSATHEYDITVKLNGTDISEFIDYSKVEIVVECVSEGWTINNPSSDNIKGIYDTYKHLIQIMSQDDEFSNQQIYYETGEVNISDSEILEDLMKMIDGKIEKDEVIERYPFNEIDEAQYIRIYNDYDSYYLMIDPNMYDNAFDYDRGKIEITHIENGWMIKDPKNIEIEENIYKPHKDGKPAPKKEEELVLHKDNYIDVYMLNTYPAPRIKIDDELATKIVEALKASSHTIVPMEYEGKDKEDAFHSCGIFVFLEDMGHERPVEIWMNSDGIKAIGKFSKESPVSEYAYDEIVKLVESETDWHKVSLSEIHDIVSAELYYGDKRVGKTKDKGDLQKIEKLFSVTMNMNGATSCPFDAKLILKRADGEKVEVILATDSCNVMVLGSSDYYMYGNDDFDESDESQKELLNIFRYDDFFELEKK